MIKDSIDFLIENADPSIVLRIKKEILSSITADEELALVNQIIVQNNVQTVVRAQKPDGWIGNNFHGESKVLGAGMFDNMETGLRFLAEKGISQDNDYVSKAVNAFLLNEPFFAEFRQQAPEDDYDFTALGLYLLRSSVILRAGYENLLPKNDFIDLRHDVAFSYETFLNVLNYNNADDVVDTSRRKLCFKKGVKWPCSYDLRILAHSQSWRSSSNLQLLADSLNRLFSLKHKEEQMIYTYNAQKQYQSPCLAFIHNQMFCLGLMDESYPQLDLMELFARCGVINKVAFLRMKYKYILSLIGDDHSIKYKFSTADRKWGPYGGFALECDWKSKIRKQCDVLFRTLLIDHYTECV